MSTLANQADKEVCDQVLHSYRRTLRVLGGSWLALLVTFILIMPAPWTSLRNTIGWVIMFVPLGAVIIWFWRGYDLVREEIAVGVTFAMEGVVEKQDTDGDWWGLGLIWLNGTKLRVPRVVNDDYAKQVRTKGQGHAWLRVLPNKSVAFRPDQIRVKYLPQSRIVINVDVLQDFSEVIKIVSERRT